jgi:glycosyltransferase involved in cell wall biosynthesis
MRLGVNGWRLHGISTGVGRYLRNLLARWTPEARRDRFDEVSLYTPTAIDRELTTLPDGVRERVLRPATTMLLWENLRFGPAADDDVLFCPSYTRPFVARGATVVAIHDATSELFPQLYSRTQPLYNRLYGWSGRHATLVLTSTRAARDDIARSWGVDPFRIRVVPLAAADAFGPVDDDAGTRAAALLGFSEPFFLFIGKASGRRRVPVLVDGFAAFRETSGLPHHLVLVGPQPDERQEVAAGAAALDEAVHHTGFVPDADLNVLYNAAEAVVCPSIYETVSLPMFEAQAAGAPIVCIESRGARETTDGAALFLPALTTRELAGALGRLAGDAGLRAELREAGRVSAGRFSWTRTAAETLDVCAEAAELADRRR